MVLTKMRQARQLLRETAVEIFGTVVSDERAPHGVELKADYWNVVGPSDPELEERYVLLGYILVRWKG